MNKKDILPNAKKTKNIVVRERMFSHSQRIDKLYSSKKYFDLSNPVLSGIASLANIAGNHYTFDKYMNQNNDEKALASDWNQVGDSIFNAILSASN